MTTGYEWSARVGDSWAAEWRSTDLSFAALSEHLDSAIRDAAPQTGKAIDIGCGAGATSIALAKARPSLDVTGIDISERLVATAAERGDGLPNLHFRVGDAAALNERGVDLFVSRHGVMFFEDPVAAFGAFLRAANPGARLVFSCFRDFALNPWAAETVSAITGSKPPQPGTAPGPFAFANAERVRSILAEAGWHGEATPIDYAYRAGEGSGAGSDALAFFSRIGPAAAQLAALDDDARDAGRERLRTYLGAREHDGAVEFPAAAWIWTATAGEAA